VSNWYAVHTRSNYEQRIGAELVRKGFECYVPVFREVHQWKDRRKMVEVPVFRSYVFGRFSDTNQSRQAVLRCDGAVRILGSGNTITPIPEREIETLQGMLKKAASRCLAHPLLQEGAWVRVKRGPLKDLEGLLVRVKNQTRLVISIALLSQAVSAEVDAGDVQLCAVPGNQSDWRTLGAKSSRSRRCAGSL
jgi:transcription antitermination factor NusG